MNGTRESSTQHPTLMDLKLEQLEALESGDIARVKACQEAIFRRLEEAQAAAALNPEA